MNRVTPYAKAIIAALIPVAQLAYGFYSDGVLTGNEKRDVIFGALGALLVLLVPAKGYRAPGEAGTGDLTGPGQPTTYHRGGPVGPYDLGDPRG